MTADTGPKAPPALDDGDPIGDYFDGEREGSTDPLDFFAVGPKGGTGGVLAVKLKGAVLRRATLARGHDGDIWSFVGGVWGWDQHVTGAVVERLLRDRYRPMHSSMIVEMVTQTPPMELTDDGHPGTINFRNGMLDLSSGELTEHDPAMGSTVQIPWNYQPTDELPEVFLGWLSEVVPAGVGDLLLEILGYSMLDANPLQRAVMLIGDGANGKGTLLRLVESIVGAHNFSSETLQQLGADRFSSAELFGKLVNVAGDLPSSFLEDSSVFKSVTGGDSLSAQRKYGKIFKFTPRAFPLFSANEIPQSKDVGYGYLRRWLPVVFPNRFEPGSKPTLEDDLHGEIELIIPMVIEALRDLLTAGSFTETPDTIKAAARFRNELDPVRPFVAEKLEIADPEAKYGARIRKTEIYSSYKLWTEEIGIGTLSKKRFDARLPEAVLDVLEHRLEETKYNGYSAWVDLTWSGSSAVDPAGEVY